MTAATSADAFPPMPQDNPAPPPFRGPWNEILRAVGYYLLSILITVVFTILLVSAFASIAVITGKGLPPVPVLTGSIILLATVLHLSFTLWLAVHRAKALGDVSRELALEPMRRQHVFAGALALQIVLICGLVEMAILIPAFRTGLSHGLAARNLALFDSQPLLSICFVAALNILAPISEELFFRGWLWTALRQSWGGVPTALATSCFWLALHAANGRLTPIVLIPLAAMLSVVRHYTGSVRGTMLLHAINNATIHVLAVGALRLSAV